MATFKLDQDSDTPEWEDGYLFSLIPDGGADIKLGVSISRTKVTVYYSDYRVPPGKRTASFDRQLYDGQWHTIIVTMAGQQVALRVDCGELISQKFKRNYPAFLDTTGDNIHVGNRKIQPGQLRVSVNNISSFRYSVYTGLTVLPYYCQSLPLSDKNNDIRLPR